VFINCRVTGDAAEKSFYLGRPWRPYAKTVFINCFMDKQVHPEGWHNWNKPDAEKTVFYGEYGSKGPGANPGERVKWSHVFDEDAITLYSLRNIFGDWEIN
jgi:pectinesterase